MNRESAGKAERPQRQMHNGAWIAIQVRCGSEAAVSKSLTVRGYTVFLPTCSGTETNSKVRRRALFPGYLFCRYLCAPAPRIVEIPSVIRLVSEGQRAAAIPDAEIETIRRIVASGVAVEQ